MKPALLYKGFAALAAVALLGSGTASAENAHRINKQASSRNNSEERTAEYVIVGAGAGGCVVAARLAEAGHTVILLEAGPDTSFDSKDPLVQYDLGLIRTPLALFGLWNRFNTDPNSSNCGHWNATQTMANFVSTDQNGIYYSYPRGMGAGGSVAHHALQDGVGSLQVYNNIAKVVKDDYWKGENMQRLFQKMENALFANPKGSCGCGRCGTTGWLSIQHTAVQAPFMTDVADAVISKIQVPFRENFCNPQDVAGIGNASVQVNADGTRSYVYQDLLVPVMNRTGNVTVVFNSLASEIMLEANDENGPNKYKAVGVISYDKAFLQEVQTGAAYQIEGAGNNCTAITQKRKLPKPTIYKATKEVIVSCGAIQTPQLLLRSGIGPKKHLKSVGIEPKVHLPGVGSDLMDHCEVATIFEIDPMKFIPTYQAHILLGNPGINENPAIKKICEQVAQQYPEFLNSNTASLQFDWYSKGRAPKCQPGQYPFPDVHNVPYATFFFNFDDTLSGPNDPGLYFDFYHRNQVPDINDPFNQTGIPEKANLINAQFQVGKDLNPRVYLSWLTENLLPHETAGTIRLASKDPRTAPIIQENLWKDVAGLGQMADMVMQIREIMAPLEARYGIPGQPWELFPGPNVKSRKDIIRYIQLWSSFGHHISGTCQMGAVNPDTGKQKNPRSVLDPRCRVFGVSNLRVADTSVYVRPWLHAFNTSRAGYVIGEAVSEFILNPEL